MDSGTRTRPGPEHPEPGDTRPVGDHRDGAPAVHGETVDAALAEARRGKAPWTPFALLGSTALLIAVVAGLVTLALLLIYLL